MLFPSLSLACASNELSLGDMVQLPKHINANSPFLLFFCFSLFIHLFICCCRCYVCSHISLELSFFSCISPAKHEINRLHSYCARAHARIHRPLASILLFILFFVRLSFYSIISWYNRESFFSFFLFFCCRSTLVTSLFGPAVIAFFPILAV